MSIKGGGFKKKEGKSADGKSASVRSVRVNVSCLHLQTEALSMIHIREEQNSQ